MQGLCLVESSLTESSRCGPWAFVFFTKFYSTSMLFICWSTCVLKFASGVREALPIEQSSHAIAIRQN